MKRRGFAVALASSLLASMLSASFAIPQASAVVFGEEVPEASTTAPWVASIWYTKNLSEKAEFICTGSLIKSDIVITAAHCTFDKGFYWVKLGADTLEGDEPFLEVSGTWRDTRYSKKTITNDLGLLKLTRPVTNVRPVSLPSTSQIARVSKLAKFKMYGWGLDQNDEVAKFLRTANLDLQDSAAKRAYGGTFKPQTMLASGRYIKAEKLYAGGCHGDSGGPLIALIDGKETLVGLTSWGSAEGCDRGKPTIFTRVTYYLNDISKGIILAGKAASVYNQAAPTNIERASISGTARVGSTLTCNEGVWSDNTSTINVYWSAPSRIYGRTNTSVLVEDQDAGATFTCVVVGKSRTAQVPVESKLTIPTAPVVDTRQSITGMSTTAPKTGTNLTCSNATWRNNVESTLRPKWFIGEDYGRDSLASDATLVGEGSNLILTKEIILKAQDRSIICASGATGPGGTKYSYVAVRMPYLGTPNPSVQIEGLVSNETPATGQIVTCKVDAPDQYESIQYQWTLQSSSWSSSTSAPVVGTERTFTFNSVNILTSVRKYLQCKVTVTNLVASGSSQANVYVKEPTAPEYFTVDITGLTAQSTPANQPITCIHRKLVGDEKATYTWGAGAYYFSSSIDVVLGTGPSLAFTSDIYDQVVGKALICSVEIKNSIGKSVASDGVAIEVPTIQLLGKTGHYYMWVDEKVTWQQARSNALGMNYLGMQGYLATPNSQAEFDFLRKKSGGRNFWIGVTDIEQEGCWKFADGPDPSTIIYAVPGTPNCSVNGGYTNWNSGEPNNAYGNENWAMVLDSGYMNDGPQDSLINSWGAWPTGYLVEFGGPVVQLAIAPGSAAAAPKMTATASTTTGFTTASQTVNVTFTPDRFTGATFETTRVAIRLQGPAGFSISNYLPTLQNSGATRETGNSLGDYSWAVSTGFNPVINFSFVSLPQGRYTLTVIAQNSVGTTLTSAPMAFDVFVKVPTVSATTSAGKIDSVALTWMAPSQTAGITSYLIEYSKDSSTWTTFTRPDSTLTSATVTGLEAGTSYTFRVTPTFGSSTSSNAGTLSNSATTNFQKVTNAVATPSSSNYSTVALSWSAPTITANLDNYQIEVSTDGSTWTIFERANSTLVSATVTGLAFGTSYRFRITPIFNGNLDTNGLAITPAVTTGSPTVTAATASKISGSNTSLALTWSAPASTTGIIHYQIEISSDTTWTIVPRANSTATSATITGLNPGTTYRFRVTPIFTGVTADNRFSSISPAITTNIYAITYSQNVLQDAPEYYFRLAGALANSGSASLTLNSSLWPGAYSTIYSTGGVTDGYISANATSDSGIRFTQATDFYSDSVFTVSGWVRSSSISSEENLFYIANGYNFLRLFLTPEGRISAETSRPEGQFNRVTKAIITGAPNSNNLYDGKFHHYAWVSNGAVQSLYIDGALVVQGATFGLGFSNGSTVGIGRGFSYPNAKCAGSDIICAFGFQGTRAALDELAIFNSALDPAVITRHYLAGRELLP